MTRVALLWRALWTEPRRTRVAATLFTRSVALGLALFLLVAAQAAGTGAPLHARWATATGLATWSVLDLVLLANAVRRTPDPRFDLALVPVVGAVTILLGLFPSDTPQPTGLIWSVLPLMFALGVSAAIYRRLGSHLVAAAFLLGAYAVLRRSCPHTWLVVGEALGALVGSLMVRIGIRASDRTLVDLERQDRAAAAAYTSRLAAEERGRQREWWDRLIHDRILGALKLASLPDDAGSDGAQLLAAESLAALTEEPETAEAGADLLGAVRRRAAALGLVLVVDARGAPAPRAVEEAAEAVLAEGLSNTARHSGTDRAWLRLDTGPDHLRARLGDAGRGFDPAAVGDDRRGLRGIVNHGLAAAGGSVQVTSRAGAGTTIDLDWSRPAEDLPVPAAPLPPLATASDLRWFALLSVPWLAGGLWQLAPVLADAPGARRWAGIAGTAIFIAGYAVSHLARLRPRRLWPILTAVLGGLALLSLALPPTTPPGGATALYGSAISLVAGFGVVNDRRALAWLGVGGPLVAVGTGALGSGPGGAIGGLVAATGLIAWAVGMLGAQWFYHRARASIDAGAAQERDATRQRIALEARESERTARQAALAELAVPLLTRIARREPLSAGDRSACASTERSVRDLLVASAVLDPVVAKAMSAARAAGAQVTVTADDDPAQRSDPDLGRFRSRLVAVLAQARHGDVVTARWHAPGDAPGWGTIALAAPEEDRDVWIEVPA